MPGAFPIFNLISLDSAQDDDVGRLWTLRTFGYLELYLITLVKDFESIPLDGGEVNEDIIPVVSGNETKALLLIKPFDTTFGHYNSPPFFLIFGKL